MARKIKAAAYVRMSSDDQADSPEQQKLQIKQRFGKRYSIQWFEDLGISGDSNKGVDDRQSRPQFSRMRDDAILGKFAAILAWDIDRLTRGDWLRFGALFDEVRNAGVVIETCNQGLIDLNDSSMAAIAQPITAMQKHAFLRDLSSNTTRGMQKLADEGKWTGGPPPLGYVVGSDRRLHLASPGEVELVQWVFQSYASGTESLATIVQELKRHGVKRSRNAIKKMLTNGTYLGHLAWGKTTYSKYRQLEQGIAPNDVKGVLEKHEDEWQIASVSHKPIIDRELFDRVAERFESNKRNTMPKAKGGDFVLSGMLVCAHCGWKMAGQTVRTKSGRIRYVCSGRYSQTGCGTNSVAQAELLDTVCDVLQAKLFNEKTLARIKASIRKKLISKKGRPSVDVLKQQIDGIEYEQQKMRERILIVSDENVPIVEAKLAELKAEHDQLTASLASAERPVSDLTADLDNRVDECLAWHDRLREAISVADANVVRATLRELVDRIELEFRAIQIGKNRHRYEITKGRIFMRDNLSLAGSLGGQLPSVLEWAA